MFFIQNSLQSLCSDLPVLKTNKEQSTFDPQVLNAQCAKCFCVERSFQATECELSFYHDSALCHFTCLAPVLLPCPLQVCEPKPHYMGPSYKWKQKSLCKWISGLPWETSGQITAPVQQWIHLLIINYSSTSFLNSSALFKMSSRTLQRFKCVFVHEWRSVSACSSDSPRSVLTGALSKGPGREGCALTHSLSEQPITGLNRCTG